MKEYEKQKKAYTRPVNERNIAAYLIYNNGSPQMDDSTDKDSELHDGLFLLAMESKSKQHHYPLFTLVPDFYQAAEISFFLTGCKYSTNSQIKLGT